MKDAYGLVIDGDTKVSCFCHHEYENSFSTFLQINFNDYHAKMKQSEVNQKNKELKQEYLNKVET
jgi:hypothetical protein